MNSNRNEENIVSKVIPISRKLSLSASSHFNGAGDAFFAGVIYELLLSENITEKIIETGITQHYIVL
jgi:fructose-1-phosphate kinase PfkB-like protein